MDGRKRVVMIDGVMNMNNQIVLTLALLLLISGAAMAKESREEKQARLDQVCETARLEKLLPIRKELTEQCVANKELPNRKECERFYADYGERMGGRAPLFYDLPACVEAFEYQQSTRTRGS